MSRLLRAAAVAALALPGVALAQNAAQHANFVLFGTDKPAVDRPAEETFVHPLTTPYYAEDSFVTSDLRAWYAYQDFPNGDTINGGYAEDIALQIRVALTDQLQFVAYKDGYLMLHSGLVNNDGWNDLAAGIKWNFLQDWQHQLHAAVGVGYQFPIGDAKVLQNDQELRVWASVNKGFGPLHLGLDVNGLFQIGAADALGNSDRIFWNAHVDYYVCRWFSPVLEVNGFHRLDQNHQAVPFSGVDVADLGGGSDVITGAAGGEIRLSDNLAIRAAFEVPLTNTESLYGSRVTASLVYSF